MFRNTFALTAIAAFGVVAQAQDFSKIEVRTTKLNDSTWLLQGAGGNVALSVGPDAVFLIDDDYGAMAPKLKAAIAAISKKPVQFLLNTHFHFDHSGGNEVFGTDAAVIVAHDNVRRRMRVEQLITFIGARQAASPKAALPVITVPLQMSFHINGEELQAFHVPRAHTDGDLIVHFRGSDIVHMGDTYFSGMYPFIDAGSGGTAEGMVAAADRVLAMATDKTRIIPGHGPITDKAALQNWRDMLAAATQRIKDLRKAGKSEDEIRTSKPFADFDAIYGQGFIKPEQFVAMMLGAVAR